MHFDPFVCAPMAEKKVQKTKVLSDYLSDSNISEEEVNPQLRMSEEERIYGMIKGSAQDTQAQYHIQECSAIQRWKEAHQGSLK